MNATPRSRRLRVVMVLLLCAAPLDVEAQQFACSPIVPGDTASLLARRLMGDAAAAYTHAFQVRDPARQMFVPKSQYRRLSTDWQACVAIGPLKSTPVAYAPVVMSAGPGVGSAPRTIGLPRPGAPPSDGTLRNVALVAMIASAAVLMLMLIGIVGDSLAPRPIPPVMRRAGEQFVRAFAHPLVDSSSSAPPIQVRLRFVRHVQQLEISIAPGDGRRYPNLVDHRTNVEYDVHRVMRVLGNHFVVSEPLRAAGKWVVVPIRLADVHHGQHLKQTGAK